MKNMALPEIAKANDSFESSSSSNNQESMNESILYSNAATMDIGLDFGKIINETGKNSNKNMVVIFCGAGEDSNKSYYKEEGYLEGECEGVIIQASTPNANSSGTTINSKSVSTTLDSINNSECINVRVTQFFKTKYCPYMCKGKCANGEKCKFAHHNFELRVPPDLRCTKLCETYIKGKDCLRAHCTFAHSREDLRTSHLDFYKINLCNFYKKGKCLNGALCRFAHGLAELRGQLPSKKEKKKRNKKLKKKIPLDEGKKAAHSKLMIKEENYGEELIEYEIVNKKESEIKKNFSCDGDSEKYDSECMKVIDKDELKQTNEGAKKKKVEILCNLLKEKNEAKHGKKDMINVLNHGNYRDSALSPKPLTPKKERREKDNEDVVFFNEIKDYNNTVFNNATEKDVSVILCDEVQEKDDSFCSETGSFQSFPFNKNLNSFSVFNSSSSVPVCYNESVGALDYVSECNDKAKNVAVLGVEKKQKNKKCYDSYSFSRATKEKTNKNNNNESFSFPDNIDSQNNNKPNAHFCSSSPPTSSFILSNSGHHYYNFCSHGDTSPFLTNTSLNGFYKICSKKTNAYNKIANNNSVVDIFPQLPPPPPPSLQLCSNNNSDNNKKLLGDFLNDSNNNININNNGSCLLRIAPPYLSAHESKIDNCVAFINYFTPFASSSVAALSNISHHGSLREEAPAESQLLDHGCFSTTAISNDTTSCNHYENLKTNPKTIEASPYICNKNKLLTLNVASNNYSNFTNHVINNDNAGASIVTDTTQTAGVANNNYSSFLLSNTSMSSVSTPFPLHLAHPHISPFPTFSKISHSISPVLTYNSGNVSEDFNSMATNLCANGANYDNIPDNVYSEMQKCTLSHKIKNDVVNADNYMNHTGLNTATTIPGLNDINKIDHSLYNDFLQFNELLYCHNQNLLQLQLFMTTYLLQGNENQLKDLSILCRSTRYED